MRPSYLCILHLLLVASSLHAQQLAELSFEEVPAAGLIVDDPQSSILVVESTVTGLQFNSRQGIRRVAEPEAGVFHVFLNPGVHYVEIRAEGFLVLKLPRWNFVPKAGRKIRVRPKAAVAGQFDSDRPQVKLNYAATAGEQVYVKLDQYPPQKLDFSAGFVTLRPESGAHTISVFVGDRGWQRTLDLAPRGSYEEDVVLAKDPNASRTLQQPGNLFIDSDPPGATVFLNQAEQSAPTPLTLNDLQPGTYEVAWIFPGYKPATQQVEVRALEYANVSAALEANYGDLSIRSTPEGAIVYIDEEQVGITPYIGRRDAGSYSLRLVLPYYHDQTDSIDVGVGQQVTNAYDLRPRFGRLAIETDPQGATVRVDGETWGTAPVERERVLSGTHAVEIELAPFGMQRRTVNVLDGQEQTLRVDLRSSVGVANLTSRPVGARVTVIETGQLLGETPLQDVVLPEGTYTLAFALDDYQVSEKMLNIETGKTAAVDAELSRLVGHLRVESNPLKALIRLNDQEYGTTPRVIRDLPVGTYDVFLELDGYDLSLATVDIRAGEVTDHRITLGTAATEAWKGRRTKARLFALLPGMGVGQWISGQKLRAALYMVGSGLTAGLAVAANGQYAQAQTDYDDAIARYNTAVNQRDIDTFFQQAVDASDAMSQHEQRLSVAVAGFASIYAVQLVDAILFGGGQREAVRAPRTALLPNARLGDPGRSWSVVWRF